MQTAQSWHLRTETIEFNSTSVLMGIVNVTPDSFSDGGHFDTTELAVEHAMQLIREGAGIIDVGGESTRPYSTPVSESEELRRVIPVIEELAHQTVIPISIDTSKGVVAREAVAAGAEIINDVTGLEGDPKMLQVAAESKAGVCAMHMQGNPQTMQEDPHYENVVENVLEYLFQRKNKLVEAGIELDRICLDPGIGFGKTHEHNISLMQRIDRFHDLQVPILVGHSRKGFIGKLAGDDTKEKLAGTISATLHLWRKGIQVIRVHDVRSMRQAIKVATRFERSTVNQ